jgi:uncharacterized membrane protein
VSTPHAGRTVMSTARAEAFSDAVFAIAITLLILDIHPPADPDSDAGLLRALLRLWPSYLAYAVSFLLIGMVWINHHRMFHHIARVDGIALGLNVLLLVDVGFLPFPTAVLSASLHTGHGEHTAAALYGLTLTAGGIAFNAVWWYAASGHRLLDDRITAREARVLGIRWTLGPVFYLVSALVGMLNAVASIGCYLFLLVLYFFDMRPRRHATH